MARFSLSLLRPALAAASVVVSTFAGASSAKPCEWVTTWQASPQPVWHSDFLFPTLVPPVLHDQTVLQSARISVGGRRLRLVFSNAYGTQPLTIGRVTASRKVQEGAHGMKAVTFQGKSNASIAPGASLVSDPVALPASAFDTVLVSTHIPTQTPVTTFHWDARQTSWIAPGDQTMRSSLGGMPGVQATTARLLLSGIQVEASSPTSVVAVVGDSITDGAGATLDTDHRWPDYLSRRLAPHGVSVVNAGISGARLLSDGMGANALARLDRDVLAQPGVRTLIVLLGINDIAWPGTAFAPGSPRPSLDALTDGYQQLVTQAHLRGVKVIGATLPPFAGALPGTPLSNYYQADKDALRRQLNTWTRQGGAFDAVVDFDALLRDPGDAAHLAAAYDSGDHLHPGDEGNRAMADAVPIELLVPTQAKRASVSKQTP